MSNLQPSDGIVDVDEQTPPIVKNFMLLDKIADKVASTFYDGKISKV